MKRHLLYFLFSLISCAVIAQNFEDDFESYAPGDLIAQSSPVWTTWSGTEGTNEDASVTDAFASEGSNSLQIISGGGAGPQDIILPFGDRYTSGLFTYSMDLYIPEGKNAYWNFQGSPQVAVAWTMNTNFNSDGTFAVDDAVAIQLQGTYEQDQWFNITYEVNLTANIWKVLIDGNCIGTYAADNNSLASLDLFPTDGDSEFYVDNVSYSYDPNATVPALDGAIFNGVADLVAISDSEVEIIGAVFNNGTETINSFTVEYDVKGVTGTQSFDNVDIASGEFINFVITDRLLIEGGNNVVIMQLTEVNGSASDEEDCNNRIEVIFTGFTPADDRAIWVEEGTGTWCPWCPRGDVFMNRMEEKYHERFVGIAVHNNDPMAIDEWDNGIGSFPGFTGYPGVIVGRSQVVDPSQMEAVIVSRLQMPPTVVMSQGASFDPSTREMVVSVTTKFLQDYSNNSSLIVGLTEDGVVGNNSGYNQANNYAGGAAGPMAGYENLPNPVPFSQMVYNHVGRALLTPFGGLVNPFGDTSFSEGEEKTLHFSITIPDDWDENNLNIVCAFRNAFGQVDSSVKSTFDKAVDAGLTVNTFDVVLNSNTKIFPNPFSEVTNIRVQLEEAASVSIEVVDAMGKLVATRNYGTVSGDQVFQFDGSNLQAGMYFIRLNAGGKFTTKRVSIAK